MSYQQATTGKKPMSRWWWGSFLIGWLVFVIAGAAILGVWESKAGLQCSDEEDEFGEVFETCTSEGETPLFYAGVACLGIAGVLHIAYWIALIVWCTRRRHARQFGYSSNTYAMETGINKPSSFSPYQPVPEYPAEQSMGRQCGNCGAVTTGQFCANCGTRG